MLGNVGNVKPPNEGPNSLQRASIVFNLVVAYVPSACFWPGLKYSTMKAVRQALSACRQVCAYPAPTSLGKSGVIDISCKTLGRGDARLKYRQYIISFPPQIEISFCGRTRLFFEQNLAAVRDLSIIVYSNRVFHSPRKPSRLPSAKEYS